MEADSGLGVAGGPYSVLSGLEVLLIEVGPIIEAN